MTRIESAEKDLQNAIDGLVIAIAETVVNDGSITFDGADEILNQTIAQQIINLGIKSYTAGLTDAMSIRKIR
jgi:hypothetical protein